MRNFCNTDNRLIYIRLSRNESQQEFAAFLGISQTTLSFWEKKFPDLKANHLNLIAEKTGYNVEWLMGKDVQQEAAKPITKQELSDREIGRLEGKLEILERQLSFFNTHLESVMTQCAQALSHISEKTIGGETKRAREGG